MPTDARREVVALLAAWAARLRRDNDAMETENEWLKAEQIRRHAGHAVPKGPKHKKGGLPALP